MSDIIQIGVAEKCELWKLESRFFPSKVGGKPAWLELKNIPDAKQLACNHCKNPCIFLCQIYAPYEEDEKAFHRTLFVFICKNVDCCKENYNGNIKVLRSQLERINEFYLPDPPLESQDWRSDICIDSWCKTCHVCGIFSSYHCSKCKNINYCCQLHQIWDWKTSHKKLCKIKQSLNCKNILFPELELIIEPEESNQDIDVIEGKEIEKFKDLIDKGQAGCLQSEDLDNDLLKLTNEEDKTFSKFRKRIQNKPNQVLRYNRGGKPLFISSSHQPLDIPNCEKCKSARQFEFQIMPQLLFYLQMDDILNNIDWGILTIYTCKNSCITESKYVEEYVWKQDIVIENSSKNTHIIKK